MKSLEERAKDVAEAAHQRHNEQISSTFETTINISNSILKSLIAINGGASIAILAFAGSVLSSKDGHGTEAVVGLVEALDKFALGVIPAVLGIVFAYFSHICDNNRLQHYEFTYEHPYTVPTSKSKKIRRWATIFGTLGAISAFLSLALFVCGMHVARNGILG